jgi:hypothetical protein
LQKRRSSSYVFHNDSRFDVTSDLAPGKKKADDRQGVSGLRQRVAEDANSFELKILTSNPLPLKILQTLFAEPAPVKAFRR